MKICKIRNTGTWCKDDDGVKVKTWNKVTCKKCLEEALYGKAPNGHCNSQPIRDTAKFFLDEKREMGQLI